MKDTLRKEVVTNRFQVTQHEAKRIRRAEAAGGHDAGLREVLLILREKSQVRK
jgi:hypothetical protein